MTSVIEPPEKSQQYVDFDEYVDLQLQKARDGIRATDILTAVMMFGVGLMVWLLLFVILDHWVIQDGVGPTARMAMAVVFGIVSLAWLGWKVLIPYMRRVNRLFAAKQIERTQPELQSTLLNLVDLQDDGHEISPEIHKALQRRAAESMARTDVDTAIDRRPLMISVYAFCVLIVVFLLYSLFTPKRVSSSVWRAILPTADIAAPTETVIKSIEPGDAEVVPGTRLPVEVEITGETPEAVELVYTTSDRAFVDEVVPLRTDETTPGRYVGDILGVNGAGIQQSLTYRIIAGDTRSPEFTVAVHQPPTAQVAEIRLSHPDYMKLPSETQSTGNIDDYEGTTVNIEVSANMPLKSAVVTFSDDDGTDFGAENIPLRAVDKERRQFRGRWMLTIADDGVYPTHYHIDVRNDQAERDPSPTRYNITIRPDNRPEIRVISPRDPELERPTNAILPLRFAARDDFAVHTATLWKQKNDERPRVHRVLFEGFEKALTSGYDWKIGEGLGWTIQPGDRITWWIEARDNNTLRPGRKNSEKRVIVVTEEVSEEQAQEQLKQDRQQNQDDSQDDPKQSNDQNQNADQKPNEQQDSELTDKDPPKPDENEDQNDQSSEEENSGGQSGESGTEKPSEGGEGGESQDESIANDGSEDGEALKDLVERFREQQEQNNQDGTGDSDPQNPDGESDPQNADQKPNEADQKPSDNTDQPSDSDMSDPKDNKRPSDSGSKPDEQSPENQPTDGDPQKPSEPTDSADDETKPDSQTPDGANKPDSANKPSDNNSAPGGNESSETQDDPGNMSDGDGGTKTKPSTENKKPGDVTEGERVPDDGMSKPTDNADQPLDNGKPEDATDDPNTEEKPTSEAMGDGTDGEKSTDRKPNSDAESKPSSSDQKPSENNRPTDRDPDGREGNPDSKPSDTDSAEGQPGDKRESMDKADRPQDGTTDDPEQPAKRDGDTDAGEDELKSDESRPDQKSDQPDGGEKGSGKQNQEGQPGSKETGPGDQSDTPGNKETSEKPNGGEASDETGDGSSKRPSDDEQPADGMGEPSASEDRTDNPNGNQKPSDGDPGSDPGSEPDPQQPMSDNTGENPTADSKPGDPANPSDANQEQKPGQNPTGGERPNGDNANENSETKPDADPNGQRTGKGGPQGPDAGDGDQPANNANQDLAPADQPNLEDSKQAADFVLKKLEDDLKRGQVDEDWLEKMGWTDQDAAKFLDRMKQRQDPAENTPQSQAQRRQYEEWLKQLEPKSQSKTVRRRGSAVRNRADRETISAPPADAPAAIRNLYEEYLQGIAKRREQLND